MDDFTDAIGIEGERPRIIEDTPKTLAALIARCWDVSPKERPCFHGMMMLAFFW
jgi:hypothetical protein